MLATIICLFFVNIVRIEGVGVMSVVLFCSFLCFQWNKLPHQFLINNPVPVEFLQTRLPDLSK